MAQDWWSNDPVVGGPAPAAPRSPGPVFGAPPKPEKPDAPKTTYRTMTPEEIAAAGLPPGTAAQVSSEGNINVLNKPDKAANQDLTTASVTLSEVIDRLDRVLADSRDNKWSPGLGETGFTGSVMRTIPGTAGFDLAENVKTIDANAAFEKLAEMRRNSPTGGALGNVTEKELDLLKTSIASLNTAQSQEQFEQNLADARRHYLNVLSKIDPEAVAKYEAGEGDDQGDIGARVSDGSPPTDSGGGGPSAFDLGLRGLAQGAGSIVQGAGDIAGVFLNPIGQALYDATGYGNQQFDAGTILREGVGLPSNPNPVSDMAIRGGTAALTGAFGAAKAAQALRPGAVQNALSFYGRSPVADAAAGAGAGAGGEIARVSGLGPVGQAAGILAGGFGGNAAANSLSRITTPRAPNALAEAATRQGVELLPADAGGTATRILTTGAKASPLSAGQIRAQAQRSVAQTEQAARRTASGQGEVMTSDKAGEAVKGAAQRYAEKTSQRGDQLYKQAEAAAKGVKAIKPAKTVQAIDSEIARLQQNPTEEAAALVQELQALRGKIEGGISIRGLRDARTTLSQGVYDGKLRSTQTQAMYKRILGNVSDDINAGLRSVGKERAAELFRRADKFWSERVDHIENVLQPILGNDGNKSGEDVVQALESMARGKAGGNARLSRLLAEMTPEEAGRVRATVIDRMGRAKAANQDETGEVFSAATFLTNWNSMTPQAKASLFSNGELRRNLNDIATIAANMKATQSMANFSNTAMGIAGGGQAAGAVAVAALTNPLVSILIGGGQVLTGRLLSSPGFARWLARAPKTDRPVVLRKYGEQLGVIATREPLIANDIRAVQEHLRQTAAASPGRAAAEEEERDGRRVPPQ